MKFDELFNTLIEACYSEKSEKPDFADIDGDKDTKESMKKAAADKKAQESKDDSEDENEDKDLSKVPPQLRAHIKKK